MLFFWWSSLAVLKAGTGGGGREGELRVVTV